MKQCSRCDSLKDESEFTKDKSQKDGLSRWCKACKSISDKRYRCASGGGRRKEAKIVEAQLFVNGKKTKHKSNPGTPVFEKKERPSRLPGYDTPEGKRRFRNTQYKLKYGITLEEYETTYNDQEGRCPICGEWYEVLCVDHCHSSGKVRELLCNSCNSILGFSKENISTLKNAIKYIEKYPGDS